MKKALRARGRPGAQGELSRAARMRGGHPWSPGLWAFPGCPNSTLEVAGPRSVSGCSRL